MSTARTKKMSRGLSRIVDKCTLTLGQCTQTLKDKLKEDNDWEDIVAKYDPIQLLNLIEKYVLKQTESHCPYLAVQEEMRSMLNFSQGEDMTLGAYYKKFNTRVAIADCAGCLFGTKSLLDTETEIVFQHWASTHFKPARRLRWRKWLGISTLPSCT